VILEFDSLVEELRRVYEWSAGHLLEGVLVFPLMTTVLGNETTKAL
jgi:hypothetical protein